MGPRQPCATCLLRRSCHYPQIFETFVEGEPPPFLRGAPAAPRPYVCEPLGEGGELAPGDPLAFDLLLFSRAAALHPYALLAVDRMAAAGLGRGRGRFVLDRAAGRTAEIVHVGKGATFGLGRMEVAAPETVVAV